MAGEWPTFPLSELLAPDRRISYGIVQPGHHETDGVPIVRVSDIRDGRISTDGALKVAHDIEKSFLRTRLGGGELLITLVGTVGQTAIAPMVLAGWNLARAVGVLPISPDIGVRWVDYVIRAPTIQDLILARVNTTVQTTLNLTDLAAFPIPVPPKPERDAIVFLLSSLDDKIELNRRMAATLEEMARALFKSWFVDFDPVRAKAEGRDPGLPAATAALFPDTFGEDGLPMGWERRALPSLATFLNGLALQKYPAAEGETGLPVLKIPELRTGPTAKSGRVTSSLPEQFIVREGDQVFSWSGSLLQAVWTHEPAALNQHLFKVVPKDVPQWLCFFAVDLHLPEFQAIASDKAVTMGHIQRHHLDAAYVVLPQSGAIEVMNGAFEPIWRKMIAARLEAQTLSALRDTLLPKLISGELRIKDAGKDVEAA
jgi:type I restriction enzyme S subunit